ncbi:hypothetical protein WJ0W_000959 [Paenibacillus melissococcoides]|uniref:DUF4229 domain-containing protein n=1 Tax=Paenibacillus melissococcoides TaxID=2912268 RepID=A0ABN8TYF3_9BACL|nr:MULTISPECIES: hypothetical protein [Paenibacillus]MEB9897860.1 hypothetical protein [Bacillus cereus]CAH8243719.1 hypothetical protein WJ0W_000959 [Paenibacillus melissococcoides]CAH8704796.1 hypothetical protein HTL2_000692 [Paenibacillus melissococcoides]CAH8707569.1 hypothetical protein WDD9_001655 [Paenibacillus melissococcoides]
MRGENDGKLVLHLRIFRGLVYLIILFVLWAILINIWEPAAYIFVPLLAFVLFSGLKNRAVSGDEAGRYNEQPETRNEWDERDNDEDEYDEDEYDEYDEHEGDVEEEDEDEEDEEYDELVEDAAVIVAQAG